MRKFRTQEQWRKVLLDHQNSGLTVSEYCRQHKIPTSGFYKQRSLLAQLSSSEAFISAMLVNGSQEDSVPPTETIQIAFEFGTVALPSTTSATYLATLLNGLRQ